MAKTQEVEAKKRKKFEIKNGGSHQQMVDEKWLEEISGHLLSAVF